MAPRVEEELKELRRRNVELEKEAREAKEREEGARTELLRTRAQLLAVEEAEERLCFAFGELEAEGVEQARAYELRIRALLEQLAAAHGTGSMMSSKIACEI